ncbi:MAG: DUF2490 domain-containing protein [Chitinophagaceae bacterium]|nr:DUF2490 domain-containing protein [Chitinophagaceae bacterium]
MRYRIIITAILCLGSLISFAQNTRITDKNSIGWFNNFTTIKFSKKWSGHLEYQWRRENIVTDWQQSLLRTGVNYQINNKLSFRLGYAWIETFPYGDIPLQAAGKRFPEHRAFQMATITDNVNRVEISHRFMLEQRWIGRYTNAVLSKPDDFLFLNRIRYMYRMQMPIGKKKIEDKTAYAAIYYELFIGFGKNVNENVFDQNRLAILLGYRFNKKFRIEGGFLQQIVQLGREVNNRNVFQYNNGIILNSYFNFDLSKASIKN